MSERLSDADMGDAFAYADGLMSDEQRLAFDVRLSNEPELARAVEQLVHGERVMSRWRDERVRGLAPPRGRMLVFARRFAVAAALLVLAYGGWKVFGGGRDTGFEVAVARGFDQAGDLDLKVEQAPWTTSLRGGQAPTPNTAKAVELVNAAHELATKDAQLALANHAQEFEVANLFVLPIQVAQDGWAVAIGISEREVRCLVPDPGETLGDDIKLARTRVTRGLNWLPGPHARLTERGDQVEFVRGIAVHEDGPLEVLVGVSLHQLTTADYTQLVDFVNTMPAVDRAQRARLVREHLEQLGCRVASVLVKPSD